jgi:ribonuclease Z
MEPPASVPPGGGAIAHEVALPDGPDAAPTVLEHDGLGITMFRVDHDPLRRAVVSSDTRKSANLTRHAKGADLLVLTHLVPAPRTRPRATCSSPESPATIRVRSGSARTA